MRCRRKRDKPQLLVATAKAATQRLLTPFRIRQLTRRIAEGERIERETLVAQLIALGYQRTDTVAEHGEFAVRGSLIDLFPAGEELALRLDFFGDEIDSLRRFDPADQRSTDKAEAFTLMPASEALLDEDTIKRFRSRYREHSAPTRPRTRSTRRCPKAAAWPGWSIGCRCSKSKLATLFDHLGEHDIIVRDAGADKALDSRREAIQDYYQQSDPGDGLGAGQLSSARAAALYSSNGDWGAIVAERADPPRLALPRAGVRHDHRLRRRWPRAISARTRAAGERL